MGQTDFTVQNETLISVYYILIKGLEQLNSLYMSLQSNHVVIGSVLLIYTGGFPLITHKLLFILHVSIKDSAAICNSNPHTGVYEPMEAVFS